MTAIKNQIKVKFLKPQIIFVLLFFCFSNAAFSFSPCRIEGYSFEIECDNVQATSSTAVNTLDIRMNIFQVNAIVRYPHPEPIFWIPDNLGVNITKRAPAMISALRRLRNDRNFLWVDFKLPNNQAIIACDDAVEATLTLDSKIDYFYQDAFLKQCQNKLKPLDFHHFSDEKIAQHYEFVRKKLGIAQVVVMAEGKGANIAIAWQKISPNAIKFQMFDSPIFDEDDLPNARALKTQAILNEVMLRCETNPECHAQNPNISSAFKEILTTLPLKVKVKDPMIGKEVSIIMDEPLFYLAMSNFLSSPNRAIYLPTIFTALLNNDWQPLIGLLSLNWAKQKPTFNDGLMLAEQCLVAEKYPKKNVENQPKNWFYRMELNRLNKLCHVFYDQFLQVNFQPQQTIFTPTLLLIGGQTLSVNRNDNFLKQHTRVFVPNAGFGILGYGCAKDIMYRYAKQQVKQAGVVTDKILDADCLTNIPLPNFTHIN